jgi:superfamily II DNA/RNA helicase
LSDKSEHPPVPDAFAALGVRPSILRALAELKYVTPSEIQAMLIPRALAGVDILGQARTGTGKTAAFGIPLLSQCSKGLATQAIILIPTRELAVQVDAEIKRLGQYTPIRSVPVYGGQKIAAQMKFLKHHPEIVIGTPGRVIDMLDRRIINFDNIRFVVLDEVDRMLDIGFRDDIRNILSRVKGVREKAERVANRDASRAERDTHHDARGAGSHPEAAAEPASTVSDGNSEPDDGHDDGGMDQGDRAEAAARSRAHQTIFVSATISDEIDKLARRYMREPVEKLIAPGSDDKPTVENVEQY